MVKQASSGVSATVITWHRKNSMLSDCAAPGTRNSWVTSEGSEFHSRVVHEAASERIF